MSRCSGFSESRDTFHHFRFRARGGSHSAAACSFVAYKSNYGLVLIFLCPASFQRDEGRMRANRILLVTAGLMVAGSVFGASPTRC
jgi:hypothetical protein